MNTPYYKPEGIAKRIAAKLTKREASRFTRLGETDEQEAAIARVEKAFQFLGSAPGGATTIGKRPQTVILDVKHQDSRISIDPDGRIKIDDVDLTDYDNATLASKISGNEAHAEEFLNHPDNE